MKVVKLFKSQDTVYFSEFISECYCSALAYENCAPLSTKRKEKKKKRPTLALKKIFKKENVMATIFQAFKYRFVARKGGFTVSVSKQIRFV